MITKQQEINTETKKEKITKLNQAQRAEYSPTISRNAFLHKPHQGEQSCSKTAILY